MTIASAEDMPAIFTHANARAQGISDRTLYRWRDSGEIDQLARGIYAQPALAADPHLVEVAVRACNATLCLNSALARHGLIDDIPPSINLALPRRQRAPRIAGPITWHRFDEDTYDVGRDGLIVYNGLTLGIYNSVRSIIDAFRLRHLYGDDQANEALRRWVRQAGNHPAELLEMARHFPTAAPRIRDVLQILL